MERGFTRSRPGKQSLPALLERLVIYVGQLAGNVQLCLLPTQGKGRFFRLSKPCFKSLQLLFSSRIRVQGDLEGFLRLLPLLVLRSGPLVSIICAFLVAE